MVVNHRRIIVARIGDFSNNNSKMGRLHLKGQSFQMGSPLLSMSFAIIIRREVETFFVSM